MLVPRTAPTPWALASVPDPAHRDPIRILGDSHEIQPPGSGGNTSHRTSKRVDLVDIEVIERRVASLHLDDSSDGSVADDKIELSATNPDVAPNDSTSAAFQELGGDPLASGP